MIIYDYRCEECAEIFEQRFKSRDDYRKTIAVTCPICGTGLTHKIVSAPAISIWWKDPLSSEDSGRLRPSFRPAVSNRALRR